jgi:hypothetical protein
MSIFKDTNQDVRDLDQDRSTSTVHVMRKNRRVETKHLNVVNETEIAIVIVMLNIERNQDRPREVTSQTRKSRVAQEPQRLRLHRRAPHPRVPKRVALALSRARAMRTNRLDLNQAVDPSLVQLQALSLVQAQAPVLVLSQNPNQDLNQTALMARNTNVVPHQAPIKVSISL